MDQQGGLRQKTCWRCAGRVAGSRRWVDGFDHRKSQAIGVAIPGPPFNLEDADLVEIPVHDADLSTSGALSLVDVPPFLRTEGHLIEKLFVVVAAALLGSTLQWGSDYLTY